MSVGITQNFSGYRVLSNYLTTSDLMHMYIYITCRHINVYLEGVEKFLSFAFSNSSEDKILYPCKNCSISYWNDETEVHEHLVYEGFFHGYKTWIIHGESSSYFLNVPNAHENEVEDE